MKHSSQLKRLSAVMVLIAMTVAGLLWFYQSKKPAPGNAQTPAKAPVLDHAYVIPPSSAPTTEPAPIRADISAALDSATPAVRRMDLILALPSDLSEAEYKALLHEVITPPAPGTAEAWHSSYVHEICNLLQRIPACYDPFANTLATVAASRDFSEVYRDYAFQHLRILWQRSLDPQAPGVAQPRNLAIEAAFRKLLTDSPETSAQAILGLHELRHDDATPAVSDEEINRLATDILAAPAQSAPAHLPTRMTAIRIMAERKLPAAGETLRTIASSSQEHMLVRISAIGALGHTAAPADLDFLRTLSPDHPMIAEALQHALKPL